MDGNKLKFATDEFITGDGTNLNLESGGAINLVSVGGDTAILIGDADEASRFEVKLHAQGVSPMFAVHGESDNFSDLYLYESGGSTNDDYFKIRVEEHGNTYIETVDSSATAANLSIDIDGDITLDAASGNIYVKDNGGNYTPGSDYEIATKKYVDDNAGSVTVDSALTDGSTNPVENNAVFDGLATKLNLAGGTVTGTVHMDDDVKIEFGDAGEYISGDGSKLNIASSYMIDFNDSRLNDINRITWNDGSTTNTGNTRWQTHIGGYKTNNNSSSNYYLYYRPNSDNWSNYDSTPTSLSYSDSLATVLIAPYAGKITKISVAGYTQDTGATDPFKFYIFKGTAGHGDNSLTLTQIGATGTITPTQAYRQFVENTDFTTSNTFSENDSLFVMLKKDSTSGNQDFYFGVTLSGVYTA
jgi:hypothetical protein